MVFFGSNPGKRITKEELREMRNSLHATFDEHEWANVEMLFFGSLMEDGIDSGISQKEFEQGIAWLRSNPSKHKLNPDEITLLEEAGKEHLQD